LVSSPSAPTGQGAARRAQSTRARPLQLLRRQRQLSQYAAARRSHEAGLVQMAVPSQPAHALDWGEVWTLAPAVPSPPPTDYGPHLGRVATSHINGRAGWWKSPCPDLARGRGGKPPGLLYKTFTGRRARFSGSLLQAVHQLADYRHTGHQNIARQRCYWLRVLLGPGEHP